MSFFRKGGEGSPKLRSGWQEFTALDGEVLYYKPSTKRIQTVIPTAAAKKSEVKWEDEPAVDYGWFRITIREGEDILPCDPDGKSDPYTSLAVDCDGQLEKKAKTQIQFSTLSPKWDEVFDVEVKGARFLRMTCYDYDRLNQNDLCGVAFINLSKYADGMVYGLDVPLKPQGVIKIRLQYMTEKPHVELSTDTLFGETLESTLSREGGDVPHIISRCIAEVEARGMDEEGVYRLSGSSIKVQELCDLFAQASSTKSEVNIENNLDIHVVSGCLKQYLRKLPPGNLVGSKPLQEMMQLVNSTDPDRGEKLHSLVETLPEPGRSTLRTLLHHLKRIRALEKVNLMTSVNLGVVFGPTVFQLPAEQMLSTDPKGLNSIVQLLLESGPDAEKPRDMANRSSSLADDLASDPVLFQRHTGGFAGVDLDGFCGVLHDMGYALSREEAEKNFLELDKDGDESRVSYKEFRRWWKSCPREEMRSS